jgi:hypothetical protein
VSIQISAVIKMKRHLFPDLGSHDGGRCRVNLEEDGTGHSVSIQINAVIKMKRHLFFHPHQVIVVVDGPRGQQPSAWTMADWPAHDATLTDPNFTMRREELYGDDGR